MSCGIIQRQNAHSTSFNNFVSWCQRSTVLLWTQLSLRSTQQIHSSVLRSTSAVYVATESLVSLQPLSTVPALDNGHSTIPVSVRYVYTTLKIAMPWQTAKFLNLSYSLFQCVTFSSKISLNFTWLTVYPKPRRSLYVIGYRGVYTIGGMVRDAPWRKLGGGILWWWWCFCSCL